jgi:regulator of cell morphogenesis and NO signaling
MQTPAAASESLRALTARIVDTHHTYLRQEMPKLEAIIAKMTTNHGEERPVLFQVQQLLQDLQDDLFSHLAKEEQILFPFIEGLEESSENGGPVPRGCFPSVRFPVRMMFIEHDRAQNILKELRAVTGNYTPPKGTACDCAARFYRGLASLEADLLEHIRVENESLFPRAIELEEKTSGCQ